MKKLILSLLLFILSCFSLKAQDVLREFSVKNAGGNHFIISWSTASPAIRQISIQRSFDSLVNFKTILTVPDPTTPQNGYLDSKATNDHMFYRLYILLEKGEYLFTLAKRPVTDNNTPVKITVDTVRKTIDISDRIDKLGRPDSIRAPNFGVNSKNNKPNVFVPSLHVYTYKDGYVRINLPDDEDKKYRIRFFEEDQTFLFELKDIKTRTFRIDKSNFYHSGWFRFELYENEKLIEKHRFFLEKDF